MTGGGAYDGDMPAFPSPAHGEIPPVGDPAYDALLARTLPPEHAPAGLGPVAGAFAALRTATVHSGMTAEANALAAFRSAVGRPAEPARPRRRRHPMLTSLLSAKLAAAAAAAAVTLGGAAAAAYTGKLPAPAQKFAHDTIGAPKTPGTQPAHSATPQPTVLPGHSAYGLCTAYAQQEAHGSAARKATAFRKLAAAAGGAAHISAYCATVAHPGNPSPEATSTHPTGKPTTLPSHAPPTHPGKPTTLPSHAPPTHPGGKPTTQSSHAPPTHPAGKPASGS
jgi:hypothetical protein